MWKLCLIFLFVCRLSFATEYYVSVEGDKNYASVTEINADRLNHKSGDVVYFDKDDEFRGFVQVVNGVKYSSYGNSLIKKPVIFGSIEKNSVGDWSDQTGNLWLNSDATVEVGNIVVNNISCLIRVKTLEELDAQGEFFCAFDGTATYIYSESNPALYYSDIELCLKRDIFDGVPIGVTVEKLICKYGARHGIGFGDTENSTIQENEFYFIGGGILRVWEGVLNRFGNAVEIYGTSKNNFIRRNKAEEIFDAAYTVQSGNVDTIENTYVYNNFAKNCALYGWECFFFDENSSINGLYVYNNTFVNTSCGGWAANDAQYWIKWWGGGIGFYGINCPNVDIKVKNNLLLSNVSDLGDNHKARCLFLGGSNLPYTIEFDNNLYRRTAGEMIYKTSSYTLEQFSNYQTDTGQDAHSINSDPLLMPDGLLMPGSPCIGAGTQLDEVTDDFDGIARNGRNDIGARQFRKAYINNGVIRG